MSSIKIRPMDICDISSAVRIEAECFSDPWSEGAFLYDIIENTLARYIAAEISGSLCGYLGYYAVLDEGQVANIAVSKSYRHRGIGSLLVREMIRLARAENLKELTLEVRASNRAAISLYESFGFIQNGLRKGYYEDPREDALLMICYI